MSWVKQLLKEYAASKRNLEVYRQTIAVGKETWEITEAEASEIIIVSGMISDLQYSIEWMRSGRRPNTRRGVDIKDAYSRTILMDMDLIPNAPPEQEMAITQKQKAELAKILLRLTARERQCYLLHMSRGLSLAEIGKEMKLSKRSVQEYVERAKNKIPTAL